MIATHITLFMRSGYISKAVVTGGSGSAVYGKCLIEQEGL